MKRTLSDKIRHFFHILSNVRPIYWICTYIVLMPLFALIYWCLPDGEFRIPSGAGTDYGSWLYYSIVSITTLGFGDYTPAHGWAQGVTAVEVMLGLVVLGLFLNAVGSMKSEIDVESEIEKQRRLHEASENDKLLKSVPVLLHTLNRFLAYCYAVTTPVDKRAKSGGEYDEDFDFRDMRDLYRPSGLPDDSSNRPSVEGFLQAASRTSLFLDALQGRVDLTLWPQLLEDCFAFVANYQMFSSADNLAERMTGLLPEGKSLSVEKAENRISSAIASWEGPVEAAKNSPMAPVAELYYLIKENGRLARSMEVLVTQLASSADRASA